MTTQQAKIIQNLTDSAEKEGPHARGEVVQTLKTFAESVAIIEKLTQPPAEVSPAKQPSWKDISDSMPQPTPPTVPAPFSTPVHQKADHGVAPEDTTSPVKVVGPSDPITPKPAAKASGDPLTPAQPIEVGES